MNPDALIASCMDLPRLTVRSMGLFGLVAEEAELSAYERLVIAARTFDSRKGVSFRAWANLCLQGAVFDTLRTWHPFSRHHWRSMSPSEREASLRPVLRGTNCDFVTADVTKDYERVQLSNDLRCAILELPTKEATLAGYMHFYGETLEDAGARLGLSKSWACRLHARVVRTLRKRLRPHHG